MAITVNVNHYFHNDPKTDNLLSEINSKLDKVLENQGTTEELRQLASDLKTGNDALRDAIAKNSGNIANT